MTAECKVPAAAVDVPTEGGCGVSGPFDYEYANAARHESKASRGKRERAREREREREKEAIWDSKKNKKNRESETLNQH